jgi:hypothetical protein
MTSCQESVISLINLSVTDFLNNPRTGPSLVALAAGVFLSVSCDRGSSQAEWWQGEQERIGLSQQLELKKYRFEQVSNRDLESLERLRNATETAASALRSLRQQHLTLSHEVASLEGNWGEFRESTIRNQRHRAIGKTFESVLLASGRKFQGVTVAAIDDAGVTIRHADGSARLRFVDLDSDQRLFFGLEADLALEAANKEAEATVAYERWIDDRMAIVHEQERKDSEAARREDLALRQERSRLASQNAAASKTRALAQAPTAFGNRSWGYSGYYSTYRTYRPTYRPVYYYSTPSYNNCRTFVSPRTVFPQSAWSSGTGCVSSSVVPKCKSFANTTLPFIP